MDMGTFQGLNHCCHGLAIRRRAAWLLSLLGLSVLLCCAAAGVAEGQERPHKAASLQEGEATDPGRMSPPVESLLARDPLLVPWNELNALLAQRAEDFRQAEADKAPLRRQGEILRELGSLQWLLAEIRASSPDGGVPASRDSEASLRRAMELLQRAGDGAARSLLDARLRLAEVLAQAWCQPGEDCRSRSAEAVALATGVLQAERRAGRLPLTVRVRTSIARIREEVRRRDEESRGIELTTAAGLAMSNCYQQAGKECEAQVGVQPEGGGPQEYNEEAVRRRMAWMTEFGQCMQNTMKRCESPTGPAASAMKELQTRLQTREGEPAVDDPLVLEPGDTAPASAAGEAWSVARIEGLVDQAMAHLRAERLDLAEPLVREAVAGCLALNLPGGDRTVARTALAELYLQRPGTVVPRGMPHIEASLLHGLAQSSRRLPDVRLFLLWRAWGIFDSIGMTDNGPEAAYELAELLLARDRVEEAGAVIARALRSRSALRPYQTWPLLFLEAEIERRRGGEPKARQLLATLQQDVAAKDEGDPFYDGPYWLNHAARTLAGMESGHCDPSRLKSSLQTLLKAEHALLQGIARGASETRFRSMAMELEDEDRLFAPIVRCGLHDPALLRTAIERIFLRREIWRFRQLMLRSAGSGEMEEGREAAKEIIRLRRLRAQLRLRIGDEALRCELSRVPGLPANNLSPPEGMSAEMIALVEIEFAIAQLEAGFVRSQRLDEAFARTTADLWPRLVRALGADGALVGYVPVASAPAPRRIVAFVVDGQGDVTWTDLGEEEAISRRLDGAVARIASGSDDTQAALRRAGRDLFLPIAGRLQGKRRIKLLTSGLSRSIPWDALLDGQNGFLGERFAVTWLQTLEDIEPAGTGRGSGAGDAVLMAPEYEPFSAVAPDIPCAPGTRLPSGLGASHRLVQSPFRSLPGARQELARIQEVLESHGLRSRSLAGGESTEQALRSLRSPQVLHIAAHGFSIPKAMDLLGGDGTVGEAGAWPNRLQGFLEPNFLRTGLALAGANRGGTLLEDDGLVTASEAADLDLHDTSLVVLSGCGTASPTLQDLGGAYDLTLGFRMAGASSVIGSLWAVDDRVTLLLMSELYRHLAQGEPVVDALWKAKETLRQKPGLSHPYYWAGFILLGKEDVRFGAAG